MSIEQLLSVALDNDVKQLELLSSNVSNINTKGYLKQESSISFSSELKGVSVDINTQSSPLVASKSNLDIAIKNEGFLLIEKDGKNYLSRNGRLSVDDNGWLKHISGGFVIGEQGRIQLPTEKSTAVKFTSTGAVMFAGNKLAQLRTIKPTDGDTFTAVGGSLYQSVEGRYMNIEANISSHALNGSNVSSSEEMIKMIEVSRHIETLQKAAQAYDQLLNTAINELGK